MTRQEEVAELKWPRVNDAKRQGKERHAYRYLEEEDCVKMVCYDIKLRRTVFFKKPTRSVENRGDLVTCGSCRRILGLDSE